MIKNQELSPAFLSIYEQCPRSGSRAHVYYGENLLLGSQILSVYSSFAHKASRMKAKNNKVDLQTVKIIIKSQ